MRFSNPHMLFWLWILVPVLAVMIYGVRKRKKILSRFVSSDLQPSMVANMRRRSLWIKPVLVILGTGLALFSLSGPQAGFHWEKTESRGVDLMIALDCSQSMLATDVSPTRLARAKHEIIDLARLLHSDRAGLVAFSGRAVLQCPLTLDYGAFKIFLDVLTPDYLPVGGTDLSAALSTCLTGFDENSDTDKAVILITDGEDTAARGGKALDRLLDTYAAKKIKIFTIGVGDPAGAPVPDPKGGFKRDASGAIVLSKVDEKTLQHMSSVTSGRYVRSVAGDMDLEQIYSQDILHTMARKSLTSGKKKVWENRFQWALFPGVLLLLLALFIRPGKKMTARRGAAALLLVVIFGAEPVPARAGMFSSSVKQGMEAYQRKDFQAAKKYFIDAQLNNPSDPRLYYDIGTAAYAAGEYDLAGDNFSQALTSQDPSLRQKAMFNLANTRYRKGDFSGAVEGYEKLLKEFPEDKEAKENLSFVKKKLQEQKKQQNPSGQKGDEKKEDGKKDKKDNPAGQDKQNPDKQNQGQQNQEQQNQEQQGQDKNNQGRNNQDQTQKDQAPENNAPEPGETGDREKDKGAAGTTPAAASDDGAQKGGAQGLSKEAAQMLENKLNRLNDKPGAALIPAGEGRAIERDW